MFITLTASALLLLSCAMVILNLRSVAHDTAQSLKASATRMSAGGKLASRLAFSCLWIMIFALSYG